ncbi:N-acetylmuramidase family protein, partial [Erwinia amylovora]|nr:N-acetylmuramidase family protein [Erwinia amylovora]
MTAADLQRAAGTLGVPLAAVRAVNEDESRGSGFLPDGRPVILFERHVMYRQLREADQDADALAARYPNIVNPSRGGYVG